jgi:hypothetical protein
VYEVEGVRTVRSARIVTGWRLVSARYGGQKSTLANDATMLAKVLHP